MHACFRSPNRKSMNGPCENRIASPIKYEKILSGVCLWIGKCLEGTKVRYFCILFLALIILSGSPLSQSPLKSAPLQTSKADFDPEQIIQKFAQKESEFYDAWIQYKYIQTAVIRVLSVDDEPQKEKMTMISEVVFNDDGTREVKLVNQTGRLRSVTFTDEDREVIDNINPFALTTKELPLYNLKYLGKEHVDELNCYIFSVKPKNTKGKRLYFDGKIWVDDQDLQVVRTFGKAVPQTRENQFPEFETIRQVIDNKYWFPAWTHADSKLMFPGQVVHIEETITYEGYKKFGSKATIQFGAPTAPEK
jgi:hypothetical protein